jgi:hypothetical protein
MPCVGQVKDRERVCSGNEERGPYNCSDHPQEDLARFGYKLKYENKFKKKTLFYNFGYLFEPI